MKKDDLPILLQNETKRQNNELELIASENYTSKKIRELCGSILINKYAEGYPGKRYYGGCYYIDQIEQKAIDAACSLFGCKYANVQPHSGSQANAAAYKALLPNGGKILSLKLENGAHLTHGSPVSFSSHQYEFSFFPLNKNKKLSIKLIEKAIINDKPDLLLIGYSSYPYEIDFKSIKKLCTKHNILLMVDMAHIAGLVATGYHQNPCLYADVVTTTTHKTLRGPRGGLILTNSAELIKKINSAVFPYYQGGPLENIIAGKYQCFKEASTKKFKQYIQNVCINTRELSQELIRLGCDCVLSENHLTLLNTKTSFGLLGCDAEKKLEEIGIITNKNLLPDDDEKPNKTSGLRLGMAAVTTRGCTHKQARLIAQIIYYYLSDNLTKTRAQKEVKKIIKKFKRIQSL